MKYFLKLGAIWGLDPLHGKFDDLPLDEIWCVWIPLEILGTDRVDSQVLFLVYTLQSKGGSWYDLRCIFMEDRNFVIKYKVCSNCTIQDIKKATNNKNNMMLWLQNNYVYLKLDLLGITTVYTIGYLFDVHPCIIQQSAFKSTLYNALEEAKIINNKVRVSDPDTYNHYTENNGNTFAPLFELCKTSIGHRSLSFK